MSDHRDPDTEQADSVRFFRDAFGTPFAVEVVERDRWDERLRAQPPIEVADARIVWLEHGEVPRVLPPWLGICVARPPSADEAWLVNLAERLWLRAPSYRAVGAPPEDYVAAAFHALCPPHPPCELGPHARDAVISFARGRSEPLGRLSVEGRDGFDRWLRIAWDTPADLARSVLLERMLDDGAMREVAVIRQLEEAEVEPGSEFDVLARDRETLLPRLDPRLYFDRNADFTVAVAEAEEWWRRFVDAYGAHCRRLSVMASVLPSELLAALTVADLLRSLNESPRRGAPVGEDALARLEAAVDEIRRLPREPVAVPAPGIILGRVPPAFAEARLAAAAVLAAVEVHRRRNRLAEDL